MPFLFWPVFFLMENAPSSDSILLSPTHWLLFIWLPQFCEKERHNKQTDKLYSSRRGSKVHLRHDATHGEYLSIVSHTPRLLLSLCRASGVLRFSHILSPLHIIYSHDSESYRMLYSSKSRPRHRSLQWPCTGKKGGKREKHTEPKTLLC